MLLRPRPGTIPAHPLLPAVRKFPFLQAHLSIFLSLRILQLLMRRNSVGMEKAVVATLGEKLLEKDRSLSVEQCIMADGWLYYVVNIQKILRDENGTTVTNGESVLCRVDMTKGTEEVLTMFDGGALLLVTARSDAAVYLTYHFPELELGEDGSPEYPDGYYEQLPYFPANLMRWDASAGECTTLLESTYSVLYAVKFYGGRAVFITRDYDHRYAYDVKTGEIEALAPIHGTIINESYMLHYDAEGTHEKWFIKNMQTGELFSIELPTSTIYRVCNRSDKWLILKANGLYYIPMSAIGDGIQREDATPIPD